MPKTIKTPRKVHETKKATFEIIPVMMVDIVRNCARCGLFHTNVLFKSFGRKPGKYTHFGICPTTQEPILMTYTPDKPKRKRK